MPAAPSCPPSVGGHRRSEDPPDAARALHQPHWPDPELAAAVVADLSARPALVALDRLARLRDQIADAAAGGALILQAGECAERFGQATFADVARRVSALCDVADALARATGRTVVPVARMAGQYAKARSSATEHHDGLDLPSYRGDMINGPEFTLDARRHDPARMLWAYDAAAATHQHLAKLAPGLPTAHEALVLDYEEAMVRPLAAGCSQRGSYGSSADFLWVGERTRKVDGPLVALLAGLANPIGVKLGPTVSVADTVELARRLDPQRTPGRLSLITRMGAGVLARRLPDLVEALRAEGHPVAWLCDPMHANTILVDGFKTRRLRDVAAEVETFGQVLRAAGLVPAGIHLELAGENVTECLGGSPEVRACDLGRDYSTACDPRLNPDQAVQLVRSLTEW